MATTSIPRVLMLVFVWTVLALASLAPDAHAGRRRTGGSNPPLAPVAGVPDYQRPAMVRLPGVSVNVAGGNLVVPRTDLSLETSLGTQGAGATYNSTSAGWTWSFEIHYDGATFVDPTGAIRAVGAVADGMAIPGTHWVKLDATRLKTKGGLVHEFDAAGRLAAVHWVSGDFPRLAFSTELVAGEERIAEIRQCWAVGECDDLVFEVERDPGSGRVTAVTDRAGRRAEFTYTAEGRLETARDALDLANGWAGFRYVYDAAGRLLSIRNSEDEETRIDYQGGRVAMVRPLGEQDPVYSFTYHPKTDGLYSTVLVDPLGFRTHYLYDGARRLAYAVAVLTPGEETCDLGCELTMLEWSGRRLARLTLPDGTATQWLYQGPDPDDPSSVILPSGNQVLFTYQPDGENRTNPLLRPILRIEDDLGLFAELAYHPDGTLASIANGEGEATTLTWFTDPTFATNGLLASVTDPNGVTRELTHDVTGAGGHARWRISFISGTLVPSIGRDFDAVGNQTRGGNDRHFDLMGASALAYDEDRNLRSLALATADGATGEIVVEYRSDGQVLRVDRPPLGAAPDGPDHEFAYDALGRPIEQREWVDGAWQVTRFEYDALGRRTAVERPNGMRQEFAYDALGRVVSHVARWDGIEEGRATYTYEDGRVVSVDDTLRGGIESYGYDSAGRLSTVTFGGGEQLWLDWDLRSRKVREVFLREDLSMLRRLEFAYDLANREIRLTDTTEATSPHVLVERVYADDLLGETRYGNGLVRSYSYDAQTGGVTGVETVDAAANPVETTTMEGWDGPDGFSCGLIAETETHVGVSELTHEEYVFQPCNGGGFNLNSGSKVVSWLAYPPDLLAHTYTYDLIGNLVSAETSALNVLTYNTEGNRLLQADFQPSGGPTVDYVYDEAGFVTERAGVPIGWTATGRLASYGSLLLLEWDMRGRPISWDFMGNVSQWRYGGRVKADALGNPISIDYGEVEIQLTDPASHLYRHFDFRNNVKFVTDDGGTVLTHYHYSAYGVEAIDGSASDGARFAGRHQLGELMVLGARVYDPLAARFLSPDPVFNPVSQYAYTLGNPVHFWDPDGASQTTVLGFNDRFTHGLKSILGGVAVYYGGLIGFLAGGFVALPIAEGLSYAVTGEFQNLTGLYFRGVHEAGSKSIEHGLHVWRHGHGGGSGGSAGNDFSGGGARGGPKSFQQPPAKPKWEDGIPGVNMGSSSSSGGGAGGAGGGPTGGGGCSGGGTSLSTNPLVSALAVLLTLVATRRRGSRGRRRR